MTSNIPTIRAGILVVERPSATERVEVATESRAWRQWLESAHTFAYEDASGRFTARKKRRWGSFYWYAFRRYGGHFYETYLGKAADITVTRLRAVGARLNQLVGQGAAPKPEPKPEPKPALLALAPHPSAPQHPGESLPAAQGTRPARSAAPRTGAPLAQAPLTPRQREVLRLIAVGASNDDIAQALVIAPSTAKRHVSNIYLALGVNRRTQAVARAWELGLLSAPAQDPFLLQ